MEDASIEKELEEEFDTSTGKLHKGKFDGTRVLKLASRAYKRRQYEEASNYFTELILRSGQQDVEWFIKRCDCYQHLNMDAEAMLDANMVVNLQPESYKGYSLLGALNQIQGHYDEALFCYFDCLEILWLSGANAELPNVAEKCLDDIVRSARPVAELPDNIREQGVLVQLYILGNSLQREVQHTLAIRSMEVALIVCERSKPLSVPEEEESAGKNELLKMKIYFVLAQSQQGSGKFEEAIENFKSALSLALRTGDVSHETKTYLNLSMLCLDQDRYAEAAVHYIRLLAVGQDVLSAVGEDDAKYREHWSVEMEASILLNLCVALKSLRLYDDALEYAGRYDKLIGLITASPTSNSDPLASPQCFSEGLRPKSVPAFGIDDSSFFTQRSADLSGMLQSKFILGDLHELRGDLDSAMKNYCDWLKMSEAMAKQIDGADNPYVLDSASALSCQGSVFMKKRDYRAALECFKRQTQIVKATKIPQLIMESALSRGDALIALGRIEDARNVYNYAQKLSRHSMEDLEPECMCMWKVASVFAAENRFTHAAYYCEQAVALASKCEKRSVRMKLDYELALYYQHSTSVKELQKAAGILHKMIIFQEEHIFSHRANGGRCFHEEERMLERCYVGMQVILHKLDLPELSAAFGEARRRRKLVQRTDKPPQIPELPLSAVTEQDPKPELKGTEEEVQQRQVETPGFELVKHEDFLPVKLENDAVLLTYSLCDEGFLAQMIEPGVGVTKSYLSSKNDVKPYETRSNIERLLARLGKVASGDAAATHLCNVYKSELRCLPSDRMNASISLPKYSKEPLVKSDPASGDLPQIKVQRRVKTGDGGGEGQNYGGLKKKRFPLLTELYETLVEPMDDVFAVMKPGQRVIVISDEELKQVPFDSLTNPVTGRSLGDRFRITASPCSNVLKSPAAAEPEGPVKTARHRSSPRQKTGKSPRPSTSKKPSALDQEVQNYRRKELMKSYGDEDAVESLELSGFSANISRLVTATATGTNILTSPRYVPPYKQVSKKLKCTVVGCPSLPAAVCYRGRAWMPRSKLPVALKECKKVSEYFDVVPVLGEEATKGAFMSELKTSTVLHVATYADVERGTIAFTPDRFPAHDVIADEDSYLVTPDDLRSLDRIDQLKLIVLSCGQGWPSSPENRAEATRKDDRRPHHLPELFLAAGVSSVLYRLWNVPDVIADLFLFQFYASLQSGDFVSRALVDAKDAVRKTYPDPAYWSGFVLLGTDVFVDLSEVRRSQLHASLDLVGAESLDVKRVIEDVIKPETAVKGLQRCFSCLAGHIALDPANRDVTGALIELLEESMDRLTADSNTDRPVIVLPDVVAANKGAIDLLSEIGFDFQPTDAPKPPPDTFGPSPFAPGREVAAVVFPHCNKEGLLLPAHQALTGLQDLCSSDVALQCLARLLPLSQSLLCCIIDLLAVTRHTPEVQLRVNDDGVRLLWRERFVKKYLVEIGFKQVHGLIVFFKTSRHRTLLIASLQLFASLCLHRDQSVLERLNVSSLGQPPTVDSPIVKQRLKTIEPVVLPRKEVILLSSWMRDQGHSEDREIKNLARRLSEAKAEYRRSLEHAKWWHKDLLTPQAQIRLSEVGREKAPKAIKRKVKPGATPSCQRESVDGVDETGPRDREPFFRSFVDAMKKRDYANYLAKKRCDQLENRYQAKIHEIYRQFAVNG